jgi:hypothetical protein
VFKDARVVQSIEFQDMLRGAGGAHGLAVKDGDLLQPLRNDFPATLVLDLKSPRAAYPAPFHQPDGELEQIVVIEGPEEAELGLADDPGLPQRFDVVKR